MRYQPASASAAAGRAKGLSWFDWLLIQCGRLRHLALASTLVRRDDVSQLQTACNREEGK
jgi:hypothetical protein